jgi:hypothetical protein
LEPELFTPQGLEQGLFRERLGGSARREQQSEREEHGGGARRLHIAIEYAL